MKKTKKMLCSLFLLFALTGCADTTNTDEKTTNNNDTDTTVESSYSGELTIVTPFTNTEEKFGEIQNNFNKLYPDVTLSFESTGSDYDEYITTRMTTGSYGDILVVPFELVNKPTELTTFLEPLGSTEEMSKIYNFTDQAIYEGDTYALPISLNTLGMLYNENVFNTAGIEVPTSSAEVYEASKKILENTDAIPFYSNLNSMPFFWSGAITSYGGEQYKSNILEQGTIVQEGQAYREILDFLQTMVIEGYTEADPMTGDPGESMEMVANGDAGFIIMGSQLLSDIMSMSETPEAIKMAPFPVQYNDTSYMPLGADELIGISANSENKEVARLFYDYLLSPESGFAFNNGGFSPQKEGNDIAPDYLAYQVTEFDTIRTIATETNEVTEKFLEVSQKANMTSMRTIIPELLGVIMDNEEYSLWIEDLENRWQNAQSE